MRATITVVTPRRAHREDTVVEAPAATPSGELVVELARLVEADQAAPLILDGAPLERRRALMRSTEAFDAVLARHGRALQASKVVTEGIVRAVAEETIRNRNTGAGYGSDAAATTASGAAVTLNRRA